MYKVKLGTMDFHGTNKIKIALVLNQARRHKEFCGFGAPHSLNLDTRRR
jgi:hypothetical protein